MCGVWIWQLVNSCTLTFLIWIWIPNVHWYRVQYQLSHRLLWQIWNMTIAKALWRNMRSFSLTCWEKAWESEVTRVRDKSLNKWPASQIQISVIDQRPCCIPAALPPCQISLLSEREAPETHKPIKWRNSSWLFYHSVHLLFRPQWPPSCQGEQSRSVLTLPGGSVVASSHTHLLTTVGFLLNGYQRMK